MLRNVVLICSILFSALVVAAWAEDKFGVAVYPGAKFDAATTKAVKEALSTEIACYRTGDGVARVAEFYKKQPGLKFMAADKESAAFQKGSGMVTIQNPWMDMKTGKLNRDTLISIGK